MTEPIFSSPGHCPICDKDVVFSAANAWFRDSLFCSSCQSVPRERAVMHVLQKLKPNWRTLSIHESSPADRATSRRLRLDAPGYVATQFDPNIPRGTIDPEKGYRCEDLASQTFADASFDIVVTQDVFEHLRDPNGAIREIARTLRPFGAHICSVPIVRKFERSRPRAVWDVSGNIDHLLEPEYHGNPIGNDGALVVWDWGYDIASVFTTNSGMQTIIVQIDNIELGIRAEFIEIVVSVKSG